ncbi:enoyl-CoA hydratase/isomerase family protein [Microbacterium sp. No. 7]|uniref:enoyl-CoA hydratase/isomerase family protein n=1 Tax=Microbacterium sp. No. 7 TaxID=1714373 RepID=UPI0006D139B3|nr:enoyl-CoA hydratase-related protein [Microbacterium sp. No. 7]ALJ21902.1 hypothetical protein AOA12_19160 [Microbacterium sp. No. 7]
MSQGEDDVLFETVGAVGVITLNRPEKLNALTLRMFAMMQDMLEECRSSRIRAVVFQGAGRAFTAGDDVSAEGFRAGAEERRHGDYGQNAPSSFFTHPGPYGLWRDIRFFPKPVIAAVQGHCAGAGADIALACDLRVAADDVKLSFPYAKLGLVGGTWLLEKYVGLGLATELLLTGRLVEAEEAKRLNLVTSVTTPEELHAEALRLAQSLAEGPTKAYGYTKEALNRGMNADIQQGLEYMLWANGFAVNARDYAEGRAAFVEKRPARYTGE